MTLNGYYFSATGISEYAFFHGERNIFRMTHDALPDEPVHIHVASGTSYTLGRPLEWGGFLSNVAMPAPGASFPFESADGEEAGRLYLLGTDHYAVAMPGAALTGRVIHERPHRSICLTGLDDDLVARVEYGFERILSRERFGEWVPRRYVADVYRQTDDTLLALALCAPFLGFDGLEVR